jgi:hypothetical protein
MRFLKRSLAVVSGRSNESVTSLPWLVKAWLGRHGFGTKPGAASLMKYQKSRFVATTHVHCIPCDPAPGGRRAQCARGYAIVHSW